MSSGAGFARKQLPPPGQASHAPLCSSRHRPKLLLASTRHPPSYGPHAPPPDASAPWLHGSQPPTLSRRAAAAPFWASPSPGPASAAPPVSARTEPPAMRRAERPACNKLPAGELPIFALSVARKGQAAQSIAGPRPRIRNHKNHNAQKGGKSRRIAAWPPPMIRGGAPVVVWCTFSVFALLVGQSASAA